MITNNRGISLGDILPGLVQQNSLTLFFKIWHITKIHTLIQKELLETFFFLL